MKKPVIAAALAAFTAAIVLPVVIGQDAAYAAAKKNSMSMEKMKKKPTGKMCW